MTHKIQMVIIGSKAVHTRQNLNEHHLWNRLISPRIWHRTFLHSSMYSQMCSLRLFPHQPLESIKRKTAPKQNWKGFPLWFELRQYLCTSSTHSSKNRNLRTLTLSAHNVNNSNNQTTFEVSNENVRMYFSCLLWTFMGDITEISHRNQHQSLLICPPSVSPPTRINETLRAVS